jgi:hypothetical protein
MNFKEKPKYSGIKQLFSSSPRKKYLPQKLFFKNLLNDFDLNNPNNEMIDHMIKSGYYRICESGRNYYEKFKPKNYILGIEIIYNDTPYLFSREFSNELYDYLKSIILDLYDRNFEKDKFTVELKLKGYFDSTEQLEILKKILNKCHDVEGDLAEDFFSYLNSGDVWLKDWITTSFSEEDEIYRYYLKTTPEEKLNDSIIIDVYLPMWLEFYRRKKLIEFCNLKIRELQNSELNKIEIFNSKRETEIIFSEDGENIFNYINSNYSHKRNRAFYSYLYLYLQSKHKLINNLKKDSIIYRNYVMKNYLDGNFSKIIDSNAYKQEKKRDVFLIFDNLMKSYSANSEGKLNKTE